jgi:hypothetical protein
MGLFSAEVEGGVPDKSMAQIPMGASTKPAERHTMPGFRTTKNLSNRQAGGQRIADAFKAGIAPAGKRLQDATTARGMQDFDEKAVLAGKKAKFGRSRSGMYGSKVMADAMGRRNRENARNRFGISQAGMKAGRDLKGALGNEYVTMNQRAQQGKLTGSPAYAFGLPTMPGYSPAVDTSPKTYKTTKKKEVKKGIEWEGGESGDPGGAGDAAGPGGH